MNKFLPYILISFALVGGLYLKHYLGFSNTSESNNSVTSSDNKIDNSFESLLIYPKKNPVFDFTLIDHLGSKFEAEHFKGRWNLIFSGYTNCPDVCPNTLNQMTQMYQLMDQSTRNKFQIIFLSVDPMRDTAEHLKQYLDYFHQEFIGISGEKSQIDGLIKSLGGIYTINQQEGEYYTVDHSARIFIVGPNSERYGIFKGGILKAKDKSQLVADLTKLAE
jgi:protein SCO1/2